MPNTELYKKLKKEIHSIKPTLIKIRHQIHQNPELAFNETKTANTIETFIKKLGINLFDKFLETDVVAQIHHNRKKTIILRADMDALPIREENKSKYISQNKGVAHSCGHDGHTTIMLGVCAVLHKFRNLLPVNVRFVFQPAEEMAGGGKMMIEKGVGQGVDYAYALHCWPKLKTGVISCCPNTIFAGGHFFEIIINGTSCHGAMPQLGNSPIIPLTHIATKLELLHQKYNRLNNSVISICFIKAGGVHSIIPNQAILGGTIRYIEPASNKIIKNEFKQIISRAEEKFKVSIKLKLTPKLFPNFNDDIKATINDKEAYKHIKKTATKYLGQENYQEMPPTTTMEDFAYFLDKIPGALFLLGVGENSPPLHNPSFDFNDEALENGILMFCLLALTHPIQ